MWQDLRFGARMLMRNPGFTLIAVISLAIGVGANSAMFSVTDGLIFRPLSVPEARRLVTVSGRAPDGKVRYGTVSAPDFKDLRERARTFQGLIATQGVETSLAAQPGQAVASRYGAAVSANFFDVLRVPAALGRTFAASEDDVPNRDAVVVLSHNTWTQQFDADASIVGRTVRLGARDFTVIGVAAEGFTGLDIFLEPSFYVPLAIAPALMPAGASSLLDRRDIRTLHVVGRLAAGVSIQQANEDVRVIADGLARTYPSTNEAQGLAVRTEMETRMDNYLPSAMLGVMLMGLAIAVLGVACANVAGLLTSRAPARQREIAVRLAMGGSRRRILRQLLIESLLVSAAGGVLGVLIAYGGVHSFQQFQIISEAGARLDFVLDERALGVALVVAIASALMAGLLPAWRASRGQDLAPAMRNTTGTPPRPSPLWGRHGLVAAQIALTLVLLTVAVSFSRRFEAAFKSGPGFRTERLALLSIDPRLASYDLRRTEAFFEQLQRRAVSLSGVTSAGVTSFVPLSFDGRRSSS